MSATQTNPYYMAGTERTGKYIVTHVSDLGRFGHREIGYGKTRLRVEPTEMGLPIFAQYLTPGNGWKQPGESGENRFSKVVSDREDYEVIAKMFTPRRSKLRLLVLAGASFVATAAFVYWLSHKG